MGYIQQYQNMQEGQSNISVNTGDVKVNSISNDAIPARRLRVFLCHSSGDKPVVRNLYQRLKACNIDPWLDKENLLPGQDWQQEIRKAVRLTDVVIVCLSRESINKTGFVQKEIKFALDVADEQPEGTIFLIPLKLEECGIPERLRHLHAVNYFEEGSFDKLLSALKHRSESLKIELASIDCQPNIDKNTLHSPQTEEFALLRTLKGHSGAIWSVAISPNDQLLASGSQDTTLKIWNLHTGELLHTLKSYSGTVYSIRISPDGRTIVSGNSDGTIKIWNLATGELLCTLDEHAHFINSLAMSPDGQIIATGSGDNTIKVWDFQAKQLLYTLSEPINSIAISPDGKLLVSGDKKIKVWNLATGELLRTLSGHSRNVNSIAISLDGQIIATEGTLTVLPLALMDRSLLLEVVIERSKFGTCNLENYSVQSEDILPLLLTLLSILMSKP
jgi:WD40 repeat protein